MSYDARRVISRSRVHHKKALEFLDVSSEGPLRIPTIEQLGPVAVVGRGRRARDAAHELRDGLVGSLLRGPQRESHERVEERRARQRRALGGPLKSFPGLPPGQLQADLP